MRVATRSVDRQSSNTFGLDEILSSMHSSESVAVTNVRVDSLVLTDSPRLCGEDPEHIRLLAEASESLPPIMVHRPTMRVIDGMHRVYAARLNGTTEIPARLLDCDEDATFILAVKANVTHGLPLSHSDRAAAASRIIADHPSWSDRAVAAATGLSDKTVSRLRDRPTAESPQSNRRLGRDGRVRPLDSGTRRQHAAAMISNRPDAGLREVARVTGLSAATVWDVRRRIERGEDPVPRRYRSANMPESVPAVAPLDRPVAAANDARARKPPQPVDRDALLEKLRLDPSVRFSEEGRLALRWLYQHTVDAEGTANMARGLPDHWAPIVASLARGCATEWARLAQQLDQRAAENAALDCTRGGVPAADQITG
jgi:ParB-like chromosome segregation protein Spo0J